MIRKPVASSNLCAVGYCEQTRLLEIEFTGGGVYQYERVEPEVYRALVSSAEIGKFFQANIRNVYKTLKVGANGYAVSVDDMPITAQQVDFIRNLCRKAELWDGVTPERIQFVHWRYLVAAVGGKAAKMAAAENPTVETWVGSLTRNEASLAIDWLKKETA